MSYQFSNTIYETPTERIARLAREADPFWAVRHAGADWSPPVYELLDFGGDSIEVLPVLPVLPIPSLPAREVIPPKRKSKDEQRLEVDQRLARALTLEGIEPLNIPVSKQSLDEMRRVLDPMVYGLSATSNRPYGVLGCSTRNHKYPLEFWGPIFERHFPHDVKAMEAAFRALSKAKPQNIQAIRPHGNSLAGSIGGLLAAKTPCKKGY
jgi:hypothetical protein